MSSTHESCNAMPRVCKQLLYSNTFSSIYLPSLCAVLALPRVGRETLDPLKIMSRIRIDDNGLLSVSKSYCNGSPWCHMHAKEMAFQVFACGAPTSLA